MTLNFWFLCLHLWSAGTIDVYHHVLFMYCCWLNLKPLACNISILPHRILNISKSFNFSTHLSLFINFFSSLFSPYLDILFFHFLNTILSWSSSGPGTTAYSSGMHLFFYQLHKVYLSTWYILSWFQNIVSNSVALLGSYIFNHFIYDNILKSVSVTLKFLLNSSCSPKCLIS